MAGDEPLPSRHDAIHVMACAMDVMSRRADRVFEENVRLQKRVEELEAQLANQTISSAPPEVNATNENPDPFVP